MSEFSVNTNILEKTSSDLKSISDKLNSIASQADSTLKKTRKSCTESIIRYGKDKIAVGSILCCGQDMLNLSSVLSDVAAIYKNSENNVKDKKFASEKDSDSENLIKKLGTQFFEILEKCGFRIVSTAGGKITIERDKHIFLDSYEYLSKIPVIGNLILPFLMRRTGFDPDQLVGLKQTIVVDFLQGENESQFTNLNNFDGDVSGRIMKITYTAEGDDYKSEIEYSLLDGEAAFSANPLEGADWLAPATLIKAGGSVVNIKGSVRHGSEKDNVKIGFNFDGPSAGAAIENGIGGIEYTDAAGESHTGNGYTDEKELSASVVSGRVYVQATIDGVQNTVAVSGDAVAAGAGGELAVTDTGVSASVDAEIIAGIGLAISSVWGD